MFPWLEPCSPPDGEPCDCCWTWNDFSLNTADEALVQRRLSMCVVLAVRTIMATLRVLHHRSGTSVLGISWDVGLGVADLSVTGSMLSKISKVQGRRRVPILGTYVNRARFDISLFLCAIVHVSTLTVTLMGWEPMYDSMGMLWMIIPKILASRPREDLIVKA